MKILFLSCFEDITESLITLPTNAVATLPQDDAAFSDLTTSMSYLPRLQLMTGATKKCKAEEFPANHFALIRNQDYMDLGKSVDAIVISWRAKALDMSDEENVIESYDIKSTLFTEIAAKSNEKDSKCMYGPEFLLYIPSQDTFATILMGTKSLRIEAPNIKARMLKGVTLKPEYIDHKKYQWWTVKACLCSEALKIPNPEQLEKVLESFLNPKSQELAPVDEATTGTERAR